MKWIWWTLLIVVAGWLAWSLVVYQKASPILSAAGVEAELVEAELSLPAEDLRPIEMGYARLRLPKSIPGHPVMIEGSLLGVITEGDLSAGVGFAPPQSDEGSLRPILTEASQLLGRPLAGFFEFRKLMFSAQPFGFGSFLLMGKAEAVRRAFLLAAKSSFDLGAAQVRIAETDHIGLFVIEGGGRTIFEVYDKDRHVSQEFWCASGRVDADALAGALLHTYRFESEGTDAVSWRTAAEAAGVPFVPEPGSGPVKEDS